MTSLKLSTSRKVTPHARQQRSGTWRVVPNTFSLPPITSCPMATPSCKAVCYAERDRRIYTSVNALHYHNWDMLQPLARSAPRMALLLRDVVQRSIDAQTKAGVDAPTFRIHESGDFWSRNYAKAWVAVCHMFPNVKFWTYTRSWHGKLDVTRILQGTPNLTVYASVDTDTAATWERVRDVMAERGVLCAYMDVTPQEQAVQVLGRKAPVCPEINGKLPLVGGDATPGGAGGEGACQACGLCIKGVAPVLFPIHR